MSERYLRTDHDSPLYCPYCGRQFRMTTERYLSYGRSKVDGYALTECRHCGKKFRYKNISRATALKQGVRATFTLEEFERSRRMNLYDTDFEIECIRERLIKEKEEQIRKLTEELQELKSPKDLKFLVDRDILGVRYWDEDKPVYVMENWGGYTQWESIRKACLYLWKPNHKKAKQLRIRDLTKDEITISARMAEEMIDIWNKYVNEIYGEVREENGE